MRLLQRDKRGQRRKRKVGIPVIFTACTVYISTNRRWIGWIEVNTEIRYSSRLFATITLTGHGSPKESCDIDERREVSRLAPYNSKRGRSNFTRSTWKCFYCLGPNDRDSCVFGRDGTTCDFSLLPACKFLKKHDQFVTKRAPL